MMYRITIWLSGGSHSISHYDIVTRRAAWRSTLLNIGESQDGVTVLAEVHDFTPKDLEIDLEPKRVTIIGRGRPQVEQKAGTSADTQKRTVRLLRSVQLPVEIDAAHATARFRGGVIELKLKKAMPGKAGTVKAVSNSNLA